MNERADIKPAYTPYDGSAKPFTIGLTQLDPTHWILPDGDLDAYRAEKARLLAAHRDIVFAEEPGTEAAQRELLDTLVDHLTENQPELYKRDGETMSVGPHLVDLSREPALITAGSLVQDDFAIMRRKPTGWHLAAAYIAFPSSWSLPEKFGRTMEEIHGPVPGFAGGTRNAELISRMFDNLPPGRIVERFNWAVNTDGSLFLPKSKSEGLDAAAVTMTEETAHLRVERQTLRKLPFSGDIVFTIRIYSDPLRVLSRHPRGEEIASSFAAQLTALSPAEAAYKGLASKRDSLAAALRRMGEKLDIHIL